jgi:hypothetical protein
MALTPDEKKQQERVAEIVQALGGVEKQLHALVEILQPTQQPINAASPTNTPTNQTSQPQPKVVIRAITESVDAEATQQYVQYQGEKTFWRRYLTIQWLLFFATMGAFGAAMYYAKVAVDQKLTMEGQWSAMLLQWGTMRDTLAEIERQTPGILRGAESAQRSVDNNIQQFHAEQRAYIVTEGPPTFVSDPVPDVAIRANINFRNIGRTSAIRYTNYLKLVPFRPTQSVDDLVSFISRQFSELRERINKHSREKYATIARADLPPNGPMFNTEETPGITESDIRSLKTTGFVLFYVGMVRYDDIFNVPHETEFCWYFFGADMKTWHICDSHNVIR